MRRRPPGLTLLELLVIVFLIALMAAWGIPQWGRAVQRQEVARVASDARDLLSLVRSLAIHDPHPPDDPPTPPESEPRYEYRLEVVAAETATFLRLVRQVEVVDLATGVGAPRDTPELLKEMRVPENVTATMAPAGPMTFDRYGRAEADSTLTLSGAGRSWRLSVRQGQPEITLRD